MVNAIGISDLYPYQQILYFLSIIAVLIPAPAHFKAGNPGVILLTSWLLASQILLFTNSILWRGNVRDIPIYCDISSVILAIAAEGYEASILCITRQLYKLSKAEAVIITKAQKRRDLIVDLLIGLGVPLLVGVGHGLIQGHRYDVYEDAGCWPTTYNVTLAYPLYFIWPLVLSLISSVYGLLALHQFLKRRKSFEMLLSSNSSGMQKNRYLRLMWLCCIDLVICVPYFLYSIVQSATASHVDPWVSWEVTQYDWFRVDFYRRLLIDTVPLIRSYLIIYMASTCILSFIFFFIFGFTRETKKFYINLFYWAVKPLGIKKPIRPLVATAKQPKKRTWLDKLLRRHAIPLNSSFGDTTGSMPTFASQQGKSIPSARQKVSQTSMTDTLNWEMEEEEKNVMVIDGRRLTIPGLNRMTSFKSDEIYTKKTTTPESPTSSLTEVDLNKPFRSNV